jgi:putative heme-binding domain-containing protein
LLGLQLSKNEWHARMSRRILQERAADGTLQPRTFGEYFVGWVLPGKYTQEQQLRSLWTLHAIATSHRDPKLRNSTMAKVMSSLFAEVLDPEIRDAPENVIGWAIQLELEDGEASASFFESLVNLAKKDSRAGVRLAIASSLQRMPVVQRWPIAEALLAHAEDSSDHNLPLMYWYGIEPLVAADPARALGLASASKIEKVSRFIVRRAAAENGTLNAVLEALTKETLPRQLVLDEMFAAFEGRVNIPQPEAWTAAYEALSKSDDAAIRDKADQIAVIFGDQRILPRLRALLSDAKAPEAKRQQALDILVRGRDKDAAPAFQAAVADTALRGAAIRALSAYDHEQTPAVLLVQYAKLNDSEKRDAINTLCTRPGYAAALLDAIEKEKLPRTDLHAYNVQALLRFNDEKLQARIKSVWGEFRATAKDKQELIGKQKAALTTAKLKAADLSNGRRLFTKNCHSCHTLFGDGGKVGPDITGSNRANLDYILENLIDPSAIVGKDYRATIVETKDGRVVSGLLQKETDSAITLRTINDTVVIAKSDIEERKLSELSIMPERQLDQLQPDEVRDLIAYLAAPTQVVLRGPRSPIDAKTRKVPGAIEGESMKIIGKTAGDAGSQSMRGFTADRWSGDDQLWWTGGKPGARLDLELPVRAAGTFTLELALTKARDYGIVQLLLDDKPLGEPIDLFNSPEVITTGVLTFEAQSLTAGNHKLSLQITGANPKAAPAFMVALDYVRLMPATATSR